MKYKSLFAVVLLASSSAARAGSPSFGAAGGGYFTDQLQVIGDTASIHLRGGYWFDPTIGIEADIGLMPFGSSQVAVAADTYPDYFGATPRLNLTGRVFEDQPLHLLLTVGAGAIFKDIDDDANLLELPTEKIDADFLAAAGPGFFVPITKSGLGLRTDLNWVLNVGTENWDNHGDQFIDLEWTGGIHFLPPGVRDADDDGIEDDLDACPEEAEDFDEYEDTDGCPEADNDADGIPDLDDQCPLDAEDLDEFEDTDGCPEADNDQDGVLDGVDACPVDKGTAATDGCPDSDEDGLADNDPMEECPNEAGPAESFGCPDADGDRVPDVRDDCPDEAANEGINPKRSDGCPSIAYVADGAINIMEKVQFATGKSTLKSDSHELLDTIVELLEKYKGILHVNVEGHTDSQGNDESNMKLSQARAEAVVAYLVEKGIDPERLSPKGFGETKPIGDNDTKEGREQNRRVEFRIDKEDVGKGARKKMKKKGEVTKEAPAEAEEAAEEPKKEEAAEEPKKEEAAEEPKKEEAAEEPKREEAAEEPKKEEAAEEKAEE